MAGNFILDALIQNLTYAKRLTQIVKYSGVIKTQELDSLISRIKLLASTNEIYF